MANFSIVLLQVTNLELLENVDFHLDFKNTVYVYTCFLFTLHILSHSKLKEFSSRSSFSLWSRLQWCVGELWKSWVWERFYSGRYRCGLLINANEESLMVSWAWWCMLKTILHNKEGTSKVWRCARQSETRRHFSHFQDCTGRLSRVLAVVIQIWHLKVVLSKFFLWLSLMLMSCTTKG